MAAKVDFDIFNHTPPVICLCTFICVLCLSAYVSVHLSACYVTVPVEYQPVESDIEGGFSISAWVQAAPNTDGYILAKTSHDGQIVYYALKLRTVSTEAFSSGFLEFAYSVATNPVSPI